MPVFSRLNGTNTRVPGAYVSTEVVNGVEQPLPAFQTPVMIGAADQGVPWNVASLREVSERTRWWSFFGIASVMGASMGPDSDVTVAMSNAKKHGLPATYVVASNSLTRASVQTLRSTTVNEIKVMARLYGAPPGHTKIGLDGGVCTVTPVKRFSLLTANADAGDTRIYVKSNAWATPGATITIGSNDVTNADYTIDSVGTEVSATGQTLYWIALTTGLGDSILTADYGIALIYDPVRAEVSDAMTTAQELLDFLAGSAYLTAVKTSEWVGGAIPDDVSEASLKDLTGWATPTAGTSPAPTLVDHQDMIAMLNGGGWDEIIQTEEAIPRAFLVLDTSSTIHAEWAAFAQTRRENSAPISVTVGVGWGDIVLGEGDSTDPAWRTAQINSQDVALCAPGYGGLGANLTLAPAVWALRVSNPVPHNLTNDSLALLGEPEFRWNEVVDGHLTALCKAGVISYRPADSAPYQMVLLQGLSTLQRNDVAWNEGSNDTPLLGQIDVADYVARRLRERLGKKVVGVAAVTKVIAASVAKSALEEMVRDGAVASYSLTLEPAAGGIGWYVMPTIKTASTNDYVDITLRIEV